MSIEWDIVIKIAVPLGTLLLGKYLDQWLAKRSRLISYLFYTSAFTIRGENPIVIHTHSIVVRNAGRATANNVRIGHHILPDNYQLYPAVPHTIEREPSSTGEIVIPKLVPGEQITVSYLYAPPLLWNQINAYIKSDEGFARILNVLPTPQLPRWAIRLIWSLIFIGILTLLYLLVILIRRFVS